MRILMVLAVLAVSILLITVREATHAQTVARKRPTLTVWLMPNEPEAEAPDDPRLIAQEVEQFNKHYKKLGVEVLNTTVKNLEDQLLAWNPEFAVPTWRMVKGQATTLDAIGEWAQGHGVNVQVLVVGWARALEDLQRALKKPGHPYPPDVAQVGDTWVEFLADQDLIEPPAQSQLNGLKWRMRSDQSPVSLKYIQDIRLLYYWKRLPGDAPDEPELRLDEAKDWEGIIAALQAWVQGHGPRSRRRPMVMPIGYDFNLLHGLAPLVWAGGGEFLTTDWVGSPKVDLTSPKALKIPLLLSTSAVQNPETSLEYRVIAFPGMSHQEANGFFVDGHYSATIEPLFLLRYWRDHFAQQQEAEKLPKDISFWDYAGVAVPPSTFKGGSDLIVTRRAGRDQDMTDRAFDLARFLAADPRCKQLLAEYGHLPAQEADSGIGEYLKKLGVPTEHEKQIAGAIRRATNTGRGYPPHSSVHELESSDVLQAIHGIYIAIAEGGPGSTTSTRITEAAARAESLINQQINWRDREGERLRSLAWYYFFGSLGLISWLGFTWWVHRRRACQLRRIGGFASWALLAMGKCHQMLPILLKSRFHGLPRDQARKALIIDEGIRGWKRSREEAILSRGRLEDVIWRSIAHAIEWAGGGTELCRALDDVLTRDSAKLNFARFFPLLNHGFFRVFSGCGLSGRLAGPSETGIMPRDPQFPPDFACPSAKNRVKCSAKARTKQRWAGARRRDISDSVRQFLRASHLIREESEFTPNDPPYHFHVDCPSDVKVHLPFILEQTLVCILQNSIKFSKDRDLATGTQYFRTVSVTYHRSSRQLTVANDGQPLDVALREALNSGPDFDGFTRRIDQLLRDEDAVGNGGSHDARPRPGLGLVEVYCACWECYGGLSVDADTPSFVIKLS